MLANERLTECIIDFNILKRVIIGITYQKIYGLEPLDKKNTNFKKLKDQGKG